MQIHTPEKTKIVRDYLTLHKDDEPPLQNRTAAKVLHQKHPHLWPNFEAVRSSIRTVRGNNGEAKRSQCLPDLYRPNQKAGFVWKYPKSQIKPWTPFILNTPKNLIISDVHVPFHDNGALEAVWNHADAYRSEEHTSELQSRQYLVCRLLIEKKNKPLSFRCNTDATANTCRWEQHTPEL